VSDAGHPVAAAAAASCCDGLTTQQLLLLLLLLRGWPSIVPTARPTETLQAYLVHSTQPAVMPIDQSTFI